MLNKNEIYTTTWNYTYGGTGVESGLSIVRCNNGDYAITGYTNSSGAGDYDVWVMRVNSTGQQIWNKTCGGLGEDYGYQIVECNNGDLAIAGQYCHTRLQLYHEPSESGFLYLFIPNPWYPFGTSEQSVSET